jgi:hypothetical protein
MSRPVGRQALRLLPPTPAAQIRAHSGKNKEAKRYTLSVNTAKQELIVEHTQAKYERTHFACTARPCRWRQTQIPINIYYPTRREIPKDL